MKPLGKQIIAEFINCSGRILNNKEEIDSILAEGIKKSGLTLIGITGKQFFPVGVTSIAIISESHVAIHTYPEAGHASLDIFTCANGARNINKLLKFLREKLKPQTVRLMEIQRGNPLTVNEENWITSFSNTGFEVKYFVEKVYVSKKTKYQQLDIIDNPNFGRMMFLDKDVQIAERDSYLYDRSMVNPIIERKKDIKRVAILGGGDGGVLREVLKYKPDVAFLIDIDEEVIEAAKEYLPMIHKNSFKNKRANEEVIEAAKEYLPMIHKNSFKNKRARIVIDDANKFLAEKHGFDAIIYDLTMHPEALTNMERVEFLRQIFSGIRKNLTPDGVVSMQCCSEFDTETISLLKRLLPRYFKNIKFFTEFIPSFCENWVFVSAIKR